MKLMKILSEIQIFHGKTKYTTKKFIELTPEESSLVDDKIGYIAEGSSSEYDNERFIDIWNRVLKGEKLIIDDIVSDFSSYHQDDDSDKREDQHKQELWNSIINKLGTDNYALTSFAFGDPNSQFVESNGKIVLYHKNPIPNGDNNADIYSAYCYWDEVGNIGVFSSMIPYIKEKCM